MTKEEHKDKIIVKNKKYWDRYLELYTNLEDSISDSDISDLSDDINRENNSYLLEPIDYGKWYTFKYWKNKKYNKQKELENKELYNKRKFDIQVLLTEYRNNINEYVKLTKNNNSQKYEELEKEILNKFNQYKNDIDCYIEENKYKNKTEYEKKHKIIFNNLKQIKSDIDEFKLDLKVLDDLINIEDQDKYKKKMLSGNDLHEYIDNLIKSFKYYEYVGEIKFKISKLENLSIRILDYIFDKSSNKNHGEKLLNEIIEFSILYQINEIEKKERINIDIYQEFNDIVTNVNENLINRRNLVPKYILNKLNDEFEKNININVSRTISREFERQAKKKRDRKSVV